MPNLILIDISVFVIKIMALINLRAKFHSLKKKKKDNYGALLPGLHPTPLCSCSQGDVVTHTAWLNRSSILYAGVDKWSVDPRVSLVTFNRDEFTIKIENVDVSDEGLYVCAVQTSSRPRTTFVHIIVQVPPKIIDFSKDMVVNEGTNVTLMCLANGKPEPAINWRVHSLSGERHVGSDDEYLDIPSISRHKAGEYECMAANDIAADTRTLRLVVNYPPSVLGGRDIGVTLGQRGVLQCEADAVPAATFEWYRDDRRIFNGFDGIEINDSGTFSKLTLFNVSETDYGNYTCVAINKLGSANTSIVLYGMPSFTCGILYTNLNIILVVLKEL
uniref:Ig-like domain-containing protein n=1 Tax=Electrophorus electricus TaxID=8005 RepID=A0A4W4FQK8_ELEEL